MPDRIILIGLSGTGKSSVAVALADLIGFRPVDTDEQVVQLLGQPIPQLFATVGESLFRSGEREVLRRACAETSVVIATGGGVATSEENWNIMRSGSVIVHLTTDPDEIIRRLEAQVAGDPDQRRPLLASADPMRALAEMNRARLPYYTRADVTVDTTGKTVEAIAAEIAQAVREREAARLVPVTSIAASDRRSDLFVGLGLMERLGRIVRERWPEARRVWIISDANVLPIWGPPASQSLRAEEFETSSYSVPAGESSKSMVQLGELLDWMIAGKIDRRDIVVALGGGVIGDLGGFAAAIVLRGVPLVQVPTSLLAMVDSSVGGKTGINHGLGKNLIGAFYQPEVVVADPLVLETLTGRELTAGWAEIVKHAMIEVTATNAERPNLLPLLESSSAEQLRDPSFLERIIGDNVRLKAAVVRRDEREGGLRRLLNYGHTLGHAMEAAGYRYLHGEAVALGMRAAGRLALRTGQTEEDVVRRQDALLDRIGLPNHFEGDLTTVMDRLSRDKKAVHGALTWILPTREAGRVEVSRSVSLADVEAVAIELGASRA